MDHRTTWNESLSEASRLLSEFAGDAAQMAKCQEFSSRLADLYRRNGNLFVCGNGGSHCDAMHFAEEFTGRFRGNRRPLGALAFGDPSHVTCVGNDFGFDHIFERQLRGLGRKGDLLVGLSTSGNSKNVGLALEAASEMGMGTVALLGRDGGWLKDSADLVIIIPGKTSDRIQEMHMKIIHTAIEACERELFPENYR